eukprot:3522917-Rhodomonas_salina.1
MEVDALGPKLCPLPLRCDPPQLTRPHVAVDAQGGAPLIEGDDPALPHPPHVRVVHRPVRPCPPHPASSFPSATESRPLIPLACLLEGGGRGGGYRGRCRC